MQLLDKKIDDILDEISINSKFTSVLNDKINLNCNVLSGNFFLETTNYFPITEENNTFIDLYCWKEKEAYERYYTSNFFNNFQKNKNNCKSFDNLFILGSSPFDNYYRNMITFIPRIFFNKEKNIKLAIHRNSSNKFRNFIKYICDQMNINLQFVYLDNGFFKFNNSIIPQFFNKSDSIKLLNLIHTVKKSRKEKIFVCRQNSSVRNLINDDDIRIKLKKNGFRIINLNDFDILQQIDIFANADVIVSVTGSALTNIVFCNPLAKIIEIQPIYNFQYENIFKDRFKYIAQTLNLKYFNLIADPINTEITDQKILKNILPKVLDESNYYKNLLLKLDKLEEVI